MPDEALERLTDSAIRLKNPALWRDQMARAEGCVCRVHVGGRSRGTGFLAGPGLIVTNYHVIENVQGEIQAEFGYRTAADGSSEASQRYEVGAPVFVQPYSPADSEHPKTRLASRGELDVAVLPVAGEPERAVVEGRPRGMLVPPKHPRLMAGELVTVIQHPLGEHLQFAYDRVLEVNMDRTRVTYKVQTRPGSSGSPCFDADWNLVAIHHSGDPRTGADVGEYNEGIPIATIRECLPPALAEQLGWKS